MNYQLIPKELRPIAEKVEAQQRISEADALTLYSANDLNALGIIANVVRERKNGNYATYIHNRYINYSNICILSCQFCAFAAKKRDAHAFEYAIDEIVQAVTDALPLGVTEVHMVGGLHPTLKKEWYLELLRRLRALDPQLHIKAFTAIEARHLAQRVFRLSIRDTLEILREAGLGSITGGGAEIFDSPLNGSTCTVPGIRWAAAVHARCFTDTSKRLLIGLIICANCGNCRMRPAVLLGLFLLRLSRLSPMESSAISSAPPHLSNCAIWR
jgi:aminodeoxyfutalosine synthase